MATPWQRSQIAADWLGRQAFCCYVEENKMYHIYHKVALLSSYSTILPI